MIWRGTYICILLCAVLGESLELGLWRRLQLVHVHVRYVGLENKMHERMRVMSLKRSRKGRRGGEREEERRWRSVAGGEERGASVK